MAKLLVLTSSPLSQDLQNPVHGAVESQILLFIRVLASAVCKGNTNRKAGCRPEDYRRCPGYFHGCLKLPGSLNLHGKICLIAFSVDDLQLEKPLDQNKGENIKNQGSNQDSGLYRLESVLFDVIKTKLPTSLFCFFKFTVQQ